MALFIRQSDKECELRQNRRLEAVAFLRNSDARNRQRISHVRSILYDEPYVPANDKKWDNRDEQYKIDAEEHFDAGNWDEDRIFWKSFARRCIICVALLAVFYLKEPSQNSFWDKYKKEIKSVISRDYSEKLFDFIQQIPYTFDYEKINVEG